jgi:hypothetical protein
MAYAHAVIELDDRTIQRGEKVSESDFNDADRYAELVEGGSISDADYDEAEDEVPPPDVVEIDGVRYVKTKDSSASRGGGATDAR